MRLAARPALTAKVTGLFSAPAAPAGALTGPAARLKHDPLTITGSTAREVIDTSPTTIRSPSTSVSRWPSPSSPHICESTAGLRTLAARDLEANCRLTGLEVQSANGLYDRAGPRSGWR